MKFSLVIWILLPAFLLCQSKVDSILFHAENAEEDTIKVLHYIAALGRLRDNQPVRADSLGNLALKLSREINFVKGMNLSLAGLSGNAIIQGNYEKAQGYVDGLLELGEIHDNNFAKLNGLNLQSVVQYYKGDYQEGIQTNLQIIALADQVNDPGAKLKALNNIGICYERLADYDKALDYYRQALVIVDELDIPYNKAAILSNMGVIYKDKKDNEQARENFAQVIPIAKDINNKTLLIDVLNNLADIHIDEKEYELADQINREALTEARLLGNANGIIKSNLLEGKIQFYLGNTEESVSFLEEALSLSEKTGDIEDLLGILQFLHKAHFNLKQSDKAYTYLDRHSMLKDSIFNVEKTNELSRIETAFQVAEKDKALLTQQLKIAQQNRHQRLLIVGISGLLIFAGGTYFFMRRIIRDTKKIARQEQALNEQAIQNMKKENTILVLDAMIKGQEEERKRVAKELHDSVGSLLATIKGYFSSLKNEIKNLDQQVHYQAADKFIDQACDEVRRISHDMMPVALTEMGLVEAIQDLATTYEETEGWNVELDVRGMKDRADPEHEIVIYRIIQELLANIAKHAFAKNVLVQVIRKDKHMHLTLEDDGRGFDISKLNGQGLGLNSVRSRVEYLGGTLDIDSVIGTGSTIIIDIPNEKLIVKS